MAQRGLALAAAPQRPLFPAGDGDGDGDELFFNEGEAAAGAAAERLGRLEGLLVCDPGRFADADDEGDEGGGDGADGGDGDGEGEGEDEDEDEAGEAMEEGPR